MTHALSHSRVTMMTPLSHSRVTMVTPLSQSRITSGQPKKTILPEPQADGSLRCPHCPKSFTVKRTWYRHVATHDPAKMLTCTVCKAYSTPRADRMKTHIRRCTRDVAGVAKFLSNATNTTTNNTTNNTTNTTTNNTANTYHIPSNISQNTPPTHNTHQPSNPSHFPW